jgi:ketosteroid isomerase-like protein
MTSQQKADAVRALFSAFTSQDPPTAEALLRDDFHFTSPYDDAIDKAAYFQRCWPNSKLIAEQNIESIAVSGDDVFVMYYCKLKDGKEFRNSELHRFSSDKIRSIDVFFGRTITGPVDGGPHNPLQQTKLRR